MLRGSQPPDGTQARGPSGRAARGRVAGLRAGPPPSLRAPAPDHRLGEQSVASIAERVGRRRPGAPGDPGCVTLFAMGGAASTPTAADAAYAHRRGTFVTDVGTLWSPAHHSG